MNKTINERKIPNTMIALQLDGVRDKIEKAQAVLYAAADACGVDTDDGPVVEILIDVACDILDSQIAIIRRIIKEDEANIDRRLENNLAELTQQIKTFENEVNTI